jgi:hypothetical protein
MNDHGPPGRGLIAGVAFGLGWTEGQVCTAIVGIVVLAFSLAVGVVPAVRHGARLVGVEVPSVTAPAPGHEAPALAAAVTPASAGESPRAPSVGGTAAPLTSDESSPEIEAATSPVASSAPVPDVFATLPITGRATGLVTLGDGTVVVAVNPPGGGPASVVHLAKDGSVVHEYPLRAAATAYAGATALATDGEQVIATTTSPAAVIALDLPSGQASAVTRIPDVLPCLAIINSDACEPAEIDHKPVPAGIAIDSSRNLYVTDRGQQTVWRLAHGSNDLTQWTRDESFWSPLAEGGPTAIAVDADGSVVFAVSASGVDGAGSVFRQAVRSDGTAGARTAVAKLAAGTGAAALVLDPDSDIYLSESLLHRITVLDRKGHEIGHLPSSASTLTSPVGLALRGDTLLVTSQGAGSQPATIVALTTTNRA